VYTTDLLDPRRYLTGGEIVLTGLMWRRGPADSEAFVAAVTAAGAMALAAGDAALGSVPEDLVAACRRHRLPLLEVPVDVSFAAITERVLAARLQPGGPGTAVGRLRALASGQTDRGSGERKPASLAEVLAVAAAEYGVTGHVLSAAGRLVAGGPAAPGPEQRSVLARGWLGAAGLPATVLTGGVPYSLFGITGQPAHRLAGWFLAVAGDQAGWDADRRAIATELAAVAAGHRARGEEAQRAVRRAADGVFRRVLDRPAGAHGLEDPEIAAALRRCGLAPFGPLVAVALTAPAGPSASGRPEAAGTPGAEAGPQVARVLLEEILPAPVVGVVGAEALALAPGGAAVTDRVREAARALAGVYRPGDPAEDSPDRAAPGTLRLAFGVSVLPGTAADGDPRAAASYAPGGAGSRWTAAGIADALAQARQARRLAALLGGGARLVDAAEVGSVDLLLAAVPGEARRAFRAGLLAPLLDYDREHGTELVRTLRVFLDCSGSWTKAADTIFVHVNSLRYRIRRVEELTGRDLGSLADQAALLLALRLDDSAED
jgi:PucR-like helix-turn-helix protein/purine catabolism regulatory family protein